MRLRPKTMTQIIQPGRGRKSPHPDSTPVYRWEIDEFRSKCKDHLCKRKLLLMRLREAAKHQQPAETVQRIRREFIELGEKTRRCSALAERRLENLYDRCVKQDLVFNELWQAVAAHRDVATGKSS